VATGRSRAGIRRTGTRLGASIALALAVGLIASPLTAGATDPAPLAARLLAEPFETTGVQVTVSNMGNLAGLASDGTTAFLFNGGTGNIVTTPLDTIPMTAGSSYSATGTVHTVGWGVDGAPSIPDHVMQLSIAYSHGCIFITSGDNTEGSIRLYCIDVSDWTVSEIAVPESHPLPEGYNYTFSSLIDFPDGRIGKVSKYVAVTGGYESTLRTYTVSGTGKSATIAFSVDYLMFDDANFAVDEHGIATDGTYLYRIQWKDYNPNYKTWQLASGSAATIVYAGGFTQPFDNMHFLAHNHLENYYMVGHYNGNRFFITAPADPGPGPGNPLTPTFSSDGAIATADGCTVQLDNYDGAFTFTGSATDGTVEVSDTGLVTLSGLARGDSATVTITTSRDGYPDGSAEIECDALPVSVPTAPQFVTVKAENQRISVAWGEPASDGGSPITGYTVQVLDADDNPVPGATCTTTTDLFCSIEGLVNGTEYSVVVKATNAIGDGPWSVPVTTEPGEPQPDIVPPIPDSSDLAVSDSTPTEGAEVVLTAQGFRPDTQVDFWIHSDPQFLGSALANSSGIAVLTVNLPAGFTGEHIVQALGISPAGVDRNLLKHITISAAVTPSGLAITGQNALPLIGGGVALLLGGAVLVVGMRRRAAAR
jgi:hypothetical protein